MKAHKVAESSNCVHISDNTFSAQMKSHLFQYIELCYTVRRRISDVNKLVTDYSIDLRITDQWTII
jgi:hypothetical protein